MAALVPLDAHYPIFADAVDWQNEQGCEDDSLVRVFCCRTLYADIFLLHGREFPKRDFTNIKTLDCCAVLSLGNVCTSYVLMPARQG